MDDSRRTPAKPRILFLDDEPMVLRSIATTLRKHFTAVIAFDAKTALELCEREEGGFRVVVSDYRMPEMNGAEFLAQVRARFPSAVRILLTGAGAEGEDVTKAADLVFRVLPKPCPRDVLVRTLEEALERARPSVVGP